jgi:Cation transport ATPase
MLAIGRFVLHLGIQPLRTLAFVVLVFGGQATLYAIRDRRHPWGRQPSAWLALSSAADVLLAATLALGGIAMMRLPPLVVIGAFAAAAVFSLLLGWVKMPLFRRLGLG